MHPVSQLQWSIPGVGPLQPCFDRVEIVSSATVGKLKELLPIAALELACHRFELRTYTGPDPRLRSRMIIVGSHAANPWPILAKHEADLARYRTTRAEIAFDVDAASIAAARDGLFALIGQLGKRRHQRGHIFSVHKPDETPPAGYVAEPTFYLEDRKGSVGLKCYVRHQKRAGGGFGGVCVRLEWTLTGNPALTRHLGGNRIYHLATADLNGFLRRNLRLERVDHVALGNLFCGIKNTARRDRSSTPTEYKTIWDQWKDPNYRARRAAFLVLRLLADREKDKFGDPIAAWRTCRDSPAQIRGYLRELRDGKRPRKRGRPKQKRGDRRPITDYLINVCFQPIELIPVTAPGITMSASPKLLPIFQDNSNPCEHKIDTNRKIGINNGITPNPPSHEPD
jgi:hypothetical protein